MNAHTPLPAGMTTPRLGGAGSARSQASGVPSTTPTSPKLKRAVTVNYAGSKRERLENQRKIASLTVEAEDMRTLARQARRDADDAREHAETLETDNGTCIRINLAYSCLSSKSKPF